jgi:hypothetical protein
VYLTQLEASTGGEDLTTLWIVIGTMRLVSCCIHIIPRFQDLASNMHLSFENQGAVGVSVGMPWFCVAGRENGHLINPF